MTSEFKDAALSLQVVEDGTKNLPNSFICRLMSEIISEIFIWCLSDSYGAPNIKQAPLLLGRVCKAWRYISLHTPELWASVEFKYYALKSQNAERLKEWWSRSGTLPISFRFRIGSGFVGGRGPFDYYDHHTQVEEIVHTLCQFFKRWSRICLRSSRYPFPRLDLIQGALSRGVPLLRDLDIETVAESQSPTAPPLSFDLGNACDVEHLNFDCPTFTFQFITREKLMINLRVLKLSARIHLTDLANILRCSPALEYIHIFAFETADGFTSSGSTVKLPCLKRMIFNVQFLNRSPLYGLHTWFDELDLPVLEELRINWNDRYFPVDLISVKGLLQRSRPPSNLSLQALELRVGCNVFTGMMQRSICMERDYLIECLAGIPNLRRLVVSAALADTTSLLKNLLPTRKVLKGSKRGDEELSCLCPRLRDLVIRDCVIISKKDLLAMLQARIGLSYRVLDHEDQVQMHMQPIGELQFVRILGVSDMGCWKDFELIQDRGVDFKFVRISWF